MPDVTIRQLRNRGGDVVERVLNGEALTVTRDGRPVARLLPVPGRELPMDVIRQRWRHLPSMDTDEFRRDLTDVIDAEL